MLNEIDLKRREARRLRGAALLFTRGMLALVAGVPLSAQYVAQYSMGGEQYAVGSVWRCSFDSKAYTIGSAGALSIRPIGSGIISANIPYRRDKKGRQIVEGQWQAGVYRGLLVIQQLSDDHIGGHMLVPSVGTAPRVCTSRTAAVLASLGKKNEHGLACNVVAVSWDRMENLTPEQAMANEALQAGSAAYAATSQDGTDSSLIGKWEQVNHDRYNPKQIWLTLSANGTYEKVMQARMIGFGAVATAEKGTWTSEGTIVNLSGDKDYSPSRVDLRSFTRLRQVAP